MEALGHLPSKHPNTASIGDDQAINDLSAIDTVPPLKIPIPSFIISV
jgi:hypothetical protein